jgi:hypothetical protein
MQEPATGSARFHAVRQSVFLLSTKEFAYWSFHCILFSTRKGKKRIEMRELLSLSLKVRSWTVPEDKTKSTLDNRERERERERERQRERERERENK